MIQLTLTLKMTTTQDVETSVTVNNSPIQDYIHPDDHAQQIQIQILYLYSGISKALYRCTPT